MKVHFIGDITGNKEDYKRIIEEIKNFGWEVLTTHSLDRDMKDIEGESQEDADLYIKKMKLWIQKADVVIVDVTKPGLGAGYEIATTLSFNKPVIVMYRPIGNNTPHVLKGMQSDKLQVVSYNDKTLKDVLHAALEYSIESADTRFNFFVAPKHINYLDWIAKNRKVPRAVYLRRLIEKDMEENTEYKESEF